MLLLWHSTDPEEIVDPPGSSGRHVGVDIPHFSFPFRRGEDGHIALVEQDSLEHIDSNAQLLIRCPLGFRDERPDFGWAFPEFRTAPLDVRPVQSALEKWGHPLGTPKASEYGDTIDAAIRYIDILEGAQ